MVEKEQLSIPRFPLEKKRRGSTRVTCSFHEKATSLQTKMNLVQKRKSEELMLLRSCRENFALTRTSSVGNNCIIVEITGVVHIESQFPCLQLLDLVRGLLYLQTDSSVLRRKRVWNAKRRLFLFENWWLLAYDLEVGLAAKFFQNKTGRLERYQKD